MRNRYHRCLKIEHSTHTSLPRRPATDGAQNKNQNQIRKIKLSSTIPHMVGTSLTWRRFQQQQQQNTEGVGSSEFHPSIYTGQPFISREATKEQEGERCISPFHLLRVHFAALRHHITHNHIENQGRSPGLLDHSASKQTVPCQSITSQERFSSENDSCVLPADRTPKVPAGIAGHRASNASVRSVGTSEPSTKVKDSEDT